ncbi:helix-turn-helix domain-containing protein [Paractinoplanes brasiliensis]|uniref:Helix-turn-helix protein n=1 Tax=Paractinoplanes brasiliensis TaxID=52695 RepID=A0A4R6JP62_9ACTN|nr:helix-turn-helix transcriptional regulator [Actinoplanes brasiliensis]TDO38244.1 helix-turn-helix protein [Actinoplanes brasiliensis]GID26979.1 transcriptional regulator [Actinoplanes brasiliensis]
MSDAFDQSVVPLEEVGPKLARANVAQRLKSLREGLGLSVAGVAKTMDWSVSKLTRIEKGEVTVQPLEVRALLGHYRITDQNVVAELSRLARTSRSRQWYSRHRLTGAIADFVAFENEASVIQTWQLLAVPGLLQTREYARANTARTLRADPNDEQVKARVQLRLDRQQALSERQQGENPPKVVAVLDEAVLRRPIGGREVMARQLDHLLALAENTDVYTIGVAPLDLEHHSGLGGSFELLKFSGYTHGDVLFVEGAAGVDFLITDPEAVDRHNDLFKDLLDYGRTGDRALQMIKSIRGEMRAG